MPHVFDHGSVKWSEWQDFHLRLPGPKPGALVTELHSVKLAESKGLAPWWPSARTLSADNGALC
jgi:hypothetical protein